MMENRTSAPLNVQQQITSVVNTMVSVITNPVAFFKALPKTGGFVDPTIFLVAMGLVGGVVQIVLSFFGMGLAASFFMALTFLIIIPLASVLFGFVGAAILYVIWKVMGSREDFPTAFRCVAYASAISPITTFLNLVPYMGSLLAIGWMTYLLVICSIEVHDLMAKPCWIVFGTLAAILALATVSSQYTARKFAREMDDISRRMGKIEEMTPEEAGRKVGEFMKGLQQGAGKQ